jgi:hypothetical protein
MIRIRYFLILFIILIYSSNVFPGWNISEKKRKEVNDKLDKKQLREKKDFVVDSSFDMLKEPAEEIVVKDFTIAKVPPTIKMHIIPDMEPQYFAEDDSIGAWANWGKVTRSNDNSFFFSVGDHRGRDCQINIYEFNSSFNLIHKVIDVDDVLGWNGKLYSDGKIHGRMGIMPDGTLWAATHFGVYPDSSWWANGYRGSWLLSYNIYTHEAVNWGIPLVGNMLPEFTCDTERGRFFGTGANRTCLLWDTINKKVRYAGYPPNGLIWWERASLLDEKTGKFWSCDASDTTFYHFLSFDPEYNRFERYELSPPANQYTGKIKPLRAYTENRAMNGAFYCISMNGALFRFSPEKPAIERIGVNWDRGRYTSTMAIDPTGRYIYYMPGGMKMQNANEYGPLVQFDVKTGGKKVLAWLVDYYYKQYGYWIGGTYGMEIAHDGSFLVICMNGAFVTRDDDHGDPYGQPSLFVVTIPEEER